MINNSPIKPSKNEGVIPVFANVGAVEKYVGLGKITLNHKGESRAIERLYHRTFKPAPHLIK